MSYDITLSNEWLAMKKEEFFLVWTIGRYSRDQKTLTCEHATNNCTNTR